MSRLKRIKHIFAAGIGLTALLLMSGCNEGPWLFTSEQAREHLENRYPGEKICCRVLPFCHLFGMIQSQRLLYHDLALECKDEVMDHE